MTDGGEFGYDDPNLDHAIDHDDPNEYDVDEEQINTTQPFQPVQASTPYHQGEQMEIQTIQHEQSGLPSYLDYDFLSPEEKRSRVEKVIDFIKKRFPKADFGKIDPIAFSKKGTKSDIVTLGPKLGESGIMKKRWQRASKKLHRQIFRSSWAKG